MSRYLEDRARIPPGNLVEVKYEELDTRPPSATGTTALEVRNFLRRSIEPALAAAS
jgi:hypothetical protein